jgi:hypothetical protein
VKQFVVPRPLTNGGHDTSPSTTTEFGTIPFCLRATGSPPLIPGGWPTRHALTEPPRH